MGLLDVPKGLISRLPVVGGIVGSNSPDEPPEDEPPEDEPVEDEPDAPEEDEPDEVEDEPDAPEEDEPDVEDDKPDEPEDEPDDDEPDASADGKEDISGTTAPSIGPNTVIEKDTPEERLARHEQSDKDAMGLDKRREVIGGNYSASFGKQLLRWAIVVIVVIGAAFGLKLVVDDADKAPAHAEDRAPWTGSHQTPAPLE